MPQLFIATTFRIPLALFSIPSSTVNTRLRSSGAKSTRTTWPAHRARRPRLLESLYVLSFGAETSQSNRAELHRRRLRHPGQPQLPHAVPEALRLHAILSRERRESRSATPRGRADPARPSRASTPARRHAQALPSPCLATTHSWGSVSNS
jgi:hypothetical protein